MLLHWILGVFCLLTVCQAGKVLFHPSVLDPVHAYTMGFLAEELVRRGHDVTWVEYGPKKSSVVLPKSVKRLFWEVSFEDEHLDAVYVTKQHNLHTDIWSPGFSLDNEQTTGWLASIRLCDRLLVKQKENFEQLLDQKFDTIIVDDLYNPCGLLHTALRGSVYIYWSLTGLRTESAWANQSPSPPSYIPVPGTKLTDDLTFWERTFNVASYFKNIYIHQHIVHSRMDAVFQKHFPGVSSAFDIERNASINLVNTPPIFDFARPYMPRVNFVGALHCKNKTQLTGKLAEFVRSSSEADGFVLITTGFTADWNTANNFIVNSMLTFFGSFPKTKFVWQYNGKHDYDIPRNVYVEEWLPQMDLLGHPHCKAHISHGGLNSVIESVYYGVPVVGWPLTTRGYDSLLRVTARGAGVMVEKTERFGVDMKNALQEITTNPKYKEEMLIFQDMVRDVPYTELEHAAFWVEFIIRHQEVPQARSGADKLNVFQYFLLDVIAFLLSCVLVSVALLLFTLQSIYRFLRFGFRKVVGTKKPVEKVSKTKKRN